MATEVKLPELGENIEVAQVLTVLVAKGDTIEKDQPIIELETDKATAEVPSDTAGTVASIAVQEGDEIKVGQVILTVDAETKETVPSDNGGKRKKSGGSGSGKTKGASGSAADTSTADADADADRNEDETPPARESARKSARESGPARSRDDDGGADTAPDDEETFEEIPEGHEPAREAEAAPRSPASLGEVAPAAPSVRRLAREIGVDIDRVPGSGPGGRISEDDVKAHARKLLSGQGATAPAQAPAAGGPAIPELPDFSAWGEVEREPATKVRRLTARAMSVSWSQIPHVTQFDRADITELNHVRKQLAGRVEAGGGKLTVTAIAVKIIASAMKVFPQFNASYDARTEEMVYKKYIHVGVAVDTDRGLLVPVIRDADRKNITTISTELTDLADRARDRKIKADELQGANLNISNLGGLGTTYFSPIVAWPHVAVIGLGRATVEAIHVDGTFQPRFMLPLSVSYDHRVIDGADAARFLRWVAEAMEQPLLVALEG